MAPSRAREFLRGLLGSKGEFSIVTCPYEMGEEEAKGMGLSAQTLELVVPGRTKAEDTVRAAQEMEALGVSLLVFVGGDGTARDILDAVDGRVPVLGVPSGVKMHSAVFGINPRAAATTALRYMKGELKAQEAEALDVDEEAYRLGELKVKLYGFLMVPYEPSFVQGSKSATLAEEDEVENQRAIARHVVESMEPDTLYILGPGTTVRAIADALGLEKTLLGVDVVENGRIVHKDANEKAILRSIEGRRAKIIVAPIGRQGFIFGRGNQQISPEVIRRVGKEGIIVVATHGKLRGIDALRVDTGDERVDGLLCRYTRVTTDYREEEVKRTL